MKLLLVLLLGVSALAGLVSWHPPHALLVNAYPINSTHFTAQVGGKQVYLKQVNLFFIGSPQEEKAVLYYLSGACRYVAVDVHEVTNLSKKFAEVWSGDIYCSPNGTTWLWLKWLPLRFSAYVSSIEFVDANITVYTPVGVFSSHVPAGWYLDTESKTVLRLPQTNTSLIQSYQQLQAELRQLQKVVDELAKNSSNAAALVTQLKEKVAELQRQRRELEEALRLRESQIAALTSQLASARREAEDLRKRLEEAQKELEKARTLLTELNRTNAALRAELAQLSAEAGNEEGAQLPVPLLAAVAVAGGVVAFLFYRRRSSE